MSQLHRALFAAGAVTLAAAVPQASAAIIYQQPFNSGTGSFQQNAPVFEMYVDVDVNTAGWGAGTGLRTLKVDNIAYQSVPEPGAIGVVGGSSLLALWQRRRRK